MVVFCSRLPRSTVWITPPATAESVPPSTMAVARLSVVVPVASNVPPPVPSTVTDRNVPPAARMVPALRTRLPDAALAVSDPGSASVPPASTDRIPAVAPPSVQAPLTEAVPAMSSSRASTARPPIEAVAVGPRIVTPMPAIVPAAKFRFELTVTVPLPVSAPAPMMRLPTAARPLATKLPPWMFSVPPPRFAC